MGADRIIVAGSEGLIGRTVCPALGQTNEVLRLDLALGHDLSDESFVKSWFQENQAGSLVNLFAINDHVQETCERSDLLSISLESFQDYLRVNVTALFSVCREFARNNQSGSIVNFSSTYGVVSPLPALYPDGEKHIGYSVSKAAVIQLTRHLAVHLAPRFRVNCVVPGGIRHEQGEPFVQAYSSHAPMGRMMEAGELVGLLRYLTSPASSYATGAVFTIDGGWTAW